MQTPKEDVKEAGPISDLGDVPGLEEVDLEQPDRLLVRIDFPSSSSSFSSSSGALEAPNVFLGGFIYGDYDSLYIKTDLTDEPFVLTPAENRGDGVLSRFQSDGPIPLRPAVCTDGQASCDPAVKLEAQTTTMWVVAQKGETRAYDVAVVIANTGFDMPLNPLELKVTPEVVFGEWQLEEYKSDTSDAFFTMDLNDVDNFDPEAVWVTEVNASCTAKVSGGFVAAMKDDGTVDVSGDAIAQDRVFGYWTKLNKLKFESPDPRLFRGAIEAKVKDAGGTDRTLVVYTPCVAMRTVERFSAASCGSARDVLAQTRVKYDEALVKGWSGEDARKIALQELLSYDSVREAGGSAEDETLWVLFKSGIMGAVGPTKSQEAAALSLLTPAGEPPQITTDPLSRMVLSLVSPPEVDSPIDGEEPEELPEPGPWTRWMADSTCPPYRELIAKSGLHRLRRAADAGVVFWAGRGGSAFTGLSDEARLEKGMAPRTFDAPAPSWMGWEHSGTQQIVWTNEDISCDALASTYQTCALAATGACTSDNGQSCGNAKQCLLTHGSQGVPKGILYDVDQVDLALGRIVLGPERVAVTPGFVKAYARDSVKTQFVFLGFPFSLSGGTLLAEFLAAGANTVVGTTTHTSPEAAEESGERILDHLVEEETTAADLLPPAGTAYSDHKWRYAGAGNVKLFVSGLLNSDFAQGNLDGWKRTGDARILSQWCGETPDLSKKMLLLSTGLAFTVQTGEISQEFCLSPDKLVFESYYNFISHEFTESCGEIYEDRLEMFLEDEDGQKVYLASTQKENFIGLHALCPCNAGICGACEQCGSPDCDCGELYHPEVGVELTQWPEECWFDLEAYGPAFKSGWRHTGEVSLSSLAGGLDRPIRIVVRVSDVESSKGNTTVLVDSIQLK